ncbi:MAG: hypothetical protein AAGK14_08260 [Verrucomicrobiota bacterium]
MKTLRRFLLVLLAAVPLAAPAQENAPAQGKKFIGHRYFVEKGIGWGWIKSPGQRWSRARWSAIKEQPNDGLLSPHRKLPRASGDHEHEYELYGYWADYDAYDPKWNQLLPVFIIQSYQPLGQAKSLDRRPGAGTVERDSNPNTKRRFRVTPNSDGSWFD